MEVRSNSFWRDQIKGVVQRGEEFSVLPGYEQRLEALTLEQVQAAAQRYLRRDRYVRVRLVPEAPPVLLPSSLGRSPRG